MTDLQRARAELNLGVGRGWHIGAQLHVWLRGETVADLALGEARPGVPMTPATLVEWASATKPVTCGAAALLWQRGLFDLDDPVCRHVPAFAANGKATVTLRHLMTHAGGLTDPVEGVMPFDEAIAAVCAAPLVEGWVPGEGSAYNSVGMWAIAALVERRLLSAPVVEAMTTRHVCGVRDERLNATVDRGLGFQLGSSYAGHGYGPHASRRAFGHGGRNWCEAFADPAHGLAAAVYWNGRLDGEAQAERQHRFFAALYEDLGLAPR